MGLDVYLYPAVHADANELRGTAENAYYNRPDYDDLTDEQHKEIRDAIPPYVAHEDVPSERYPDHLFNRRYLRSSYNSGGFNSAVPDFVGEDHGLYWIFEPMCREWDGDEGTLTADDIPALRESRERAGQVVGELQTCDPLRVMSSPLMLGDRDHMWHEPPSEDETLTWYREEKAKWSTRERRPFGDDDGGYSTAKGHVLGFDKGLEVLAVVPGCGVFGEPAAIIVYRPARDAIDSYTQSAEIVVEFIDEAISLIERDGSVQMSWSG